MHDRRRRAAVWPSRLAPLNVMNFKGGRAVKPDARDEAGRDAFCRPNLKTIAATPLPEACLNVVSSPTGQRHVCNYRCATAMHANNDEFNDDEDNSLNDVRREDANLQASIA